MKKIMMWVSVCALVVLIASTACFANASTIQWGFDNQNNPYAADVLTGAVSGIATVAPTEFGSGWLYDDLGGSITGYWDLGSAGTMNLDFTTDPMEAGYVDLWLQVTYYEGITAIPAINVAGGEMVSSETSVVEEDILGAWKLEQSCWRVVNSSNAYSIVLTGDADFGGIVDNVAVTLQPVPEPSSLLAMASGLAGMAGFAIRRRRI